MAQTGHEDGQFRENITRLVKRKFGDPDVQMLTVGDVDFYANWEHRLHLLPELILPSPQDSQGNLAHIQGLHGPLLQPEIPPVVPPQGEEMFTGARGRQTSAHAVSAFTDTRLILQTIDHDTDAYFDSGSPDQFTIPTGLGGKFLVHGIVSMDADGTAEDVDIIVWIENDNDGIIAQMNGIYSTTRQFSVEVSCTVQLDDADAVHLHIFQNGSNTQHTDPSTRASCFFELSRWDKPA